MSGVDEAHGNFDADQSEIEALIVAIEEHQRPALVELLAAVDAAWLDERQRFLPLDPPEAPAGEHPR